MITHSKSIGSVPTPPSDSLRPRGARASTPPTPPSGDSLSTANASNLKAALAQTPAVRPEVVERAAALVNDPSYPSDTVIRQMAGLIARSPDPSLRED